MLGNVSFASGVRAVQILMIITSTSMQVSPMQMINSWPAVERPQIG
jgi:hypothetical protein